jgi:hypothetical protein
MDIQFDASSSKPSNEIPPEARAGRAWHSPGISVRKRILTGLGVLAATVLFFWIAISEGAPSLVSTVIGIIFIGGFVWYLRAVAPAPFTITVEEERLIRAEAGAEPVVIPWTGVARVKEEVFPNGKPCSIAIYKRVGERGVHRAWVVYGDDVPDFAGMVAAVRAGLPAETPWMRETVHE